ncbi:hypothetical protein EGI20_00930 [Aquitalea sp. S1-19]|nr:hypothetical protein [Aquitalea sp. S1-19]
MMWVVVESSPLMATSGMGGHMKQPSRVHLLHISILSALLAIGHGAQADELDAVQFFAGIRLTHDSNLFGSESNAKSDWLARTEAGVMLDKRYGLQRLKLDVSLVDYRYREYDDNDFTAYPYAASWQWVLGSRLSGDFLLQHDETQDLIDPAFLADSVNIKTTDFQRASLQWQVMQRLYLLGGFDHSKTDYSQPSFSVSEELKSAELGLRYQTPAGNDLQLIMRDGRGEEQGRFDFDQRSYLVSTNWQLADKTRLEAGLGRLERSYDSNPGRDYSGKNGYVTLRWAPTAKLQISLSGRNDVEAQQFFTSKQTTTWALEPVWQVSHKVRLSAGLSRADTDYKGAPANTPQFKETTDILRLGADWQILDPLRISTELSHERRDSTNPYPSYRRMQFWLGARFAF